MKDFHCTLDARTPTSTSTRSRPWNLVFSEPSSVFFPTTKGDYSEEDQQVLWQREGRAAARAGEFIHRCEHGVETGVRYWRADDQGDVGSVSKDLGETGQLLAQLLIAQEELRALLAGKEPSTAVIEQQQGSGDTSSARQYVVQEIHAQGHQTSAKMTSNELASAPSPIYQSVAAHMRLRLEENSESVLRTEDCKTSRHGRARIELLISPPEHENESTAKDHARTSAVARTSDKNWIRTTGETYPFEMIGPLTQERLLRPTADDIEKEAMKLWKERYPQSAAALNLSAGGSSAATV